MGWKYNHMFVRYKEVEQIWEFIKDSIKDIFNVSLLTYLFFFLIDDFINGFVSNFLDLKIILVITIVSGVLTILFESEDHDEKGGFSKNKYYIASIFFGLLSALLIYIRIKDIGSVALVVSLVSGLMVVILSMLFINDIDLNNNKE